MERPKFYLTTKTTDSTEYQIVLETEIAKDCKGVSFFTLAVDPDPNALYRIIVGKLMDVTELELTSIWSLNLPHLTTGVYKGLLPGDQIIVWHRSISPDLTVKTGVTCSFNEVTDF